MTDAAIEWWGKAGDQALRRSAFQEAISHLGKAIEMADKEGSGSTLRPANGTETISATRRLKLQTGYGRALAWSHGFGAEETRVAFKRAEELAAGVDNPDEQFIAYYGLWVGSIVGGELALARQIAETCRREAENAGRKTDIVVAHRYLGLTCLHQGELTEALSHLEEALRLYDPKRDHEANLRYGVDTGAAATIYLAVTKLLLGQLGQVRELVDEALRRARGSGHAATHAGVYWSKVSIEMLRGDAVGALHSAEVLIELSREHEIILAAPGVVAASWARARLDRETGPVELRRALIALADTGTKMNLPFYQSFLAEIEADGDAEGALARIDEALALADRDRRPLERCFPASHPRRDFIEARSGEYVVSRGRVPHRHRCCATAKGAEASSYVRRSRWQSFTNRPGGLPTPMPC